MSLRAGPAKVEVIEERVRNVPDYVAAFSKALPGEPIAIEIHRHCHRGVRANDAARHRPVRPLDRGRRKRDLGIGQARLRAVQHRGGCVACHGGWRFTDDSFHDIGTTKTDLGRGRAMKDDGAMQYAFKTPTLRSVALRPPYMHNASAANLYEVLKHYETGGIDRPSLSPMMAPLKLNEKERLDLVAFLQTLTGMPEGEAAPKLPASK